MSDNLNMTVIYRYIGISSYILVLIAYYQKPSLNAHADISYGTRGLIFMESSALSKLNMPAVKAAASLHKCADLP